MAISIYEAHWPSYNNVENSTYHLRVIVALRTYAVQNKALIFDALSI